MLPLSSNNRVAAVRIVMLLIHAEFMGPGLLIISLHCIIICAWNMLGGLIFSFEKKLGNLF